MAVGDSSTCVGVIASKSCTKCGVVKSLDAYHAKSARSDGRASACKSCTKEHQDKARASDAWREKHRLYNKQKADERQRLTGSRASVSPEAKRVQRWLSKGYSRCEATRLAARYPKGVQGLLASERKYDALAIQNARQAWDYWINHKASKKWLKAYWKSEPWKRHGISEAEKFRLRYRHDHEFCLRQKMRAHMRRQTKHDKIGDLMRDALKRNGNSNKVERLLGYTIADLKKHLESQFTNRMTWEKFNQGKIHIDHILPISSFNFTEIGDSEWRACWDLPNLRPTWAKDNLAKSNKLVFLL